MSVQEIGWGKGAAHGGAGRLPRRSFQQSLARVGIALARRRVQVALAQGRAHPQQQAHAVGGHVHAAVRAHHLVPPALGDPGQGRLARRPSLGHGAQVLDRVQHGARGRHAAEAHRPQQGGQEPQPSRLPAQLGDVGAALLGAREFLYTCHRRPQRVRRHRLERGSPHRGVGRALVE